MSTKQRWIRVNVGWDDTEWISELSAEARLSWIMLLCHIKRDGVAGRCKVIADRVAAKKWGVKPNAVREMLEGARLDGAVYEAEGEWVVTNWRHHQVDYSTERVQKMRAQKEGDETA
jgi:hypothetical protein